jgi:hypothetical protein
MITLTNISFSFKEGATEYEVRYEEISAGKYDVAVFINGNYVESHLSTGGANKSHAIQFLKQTIGNHAVSH